MKLNDVVFYVSDHTITKTRIKGIKDLLEQPRFDNGEKKKRYYSVIVRETTYSSSEQKYEWIQETDDDGNQLIFPTLEAAQKVLTDRIQKEVLDQISKIVLVDLAGPDKKEPTEDELRQ